MSTSATGLLHGPMLWMTVPVLAAVTAGSVYVAVDRNGSPALAMVLGEKFVANGNGTTGSTTTEALSGAASTSSSSTTSNGNGGVGNGNGNGNTPGSYGKAFTMTGSVSGLGPGRPVTLTVSVSNPNNQAMQVTGITGTVGTPTVVNAVTTKPACSSSWVTVSAYKFVPGQTAYTAPANSSVNVPVVVTFTDDPKTNQDNCKGAVFPITLTGTGQQA